MLLEKILKITRLLVIGCLVLTILITTNQYQQVCNNQQQYQGVEIFYSKQVYKFCGSNFSIVNRGDDPIIVETRTIDDQDVSSDSVREMSTVVATTTLDQGQSIAINSTDNIVYVIENEIGSNLEHTIGLQKIS